MKGMGEHILGEIKEYGRGLGESTTIESDKLFDATEIVCMYIHLFSFMITLSIVSYCTIIF